MQALELSITICSWNTRAELEACLSSLEALREEAAFEVIVVDNASVDGSAELVCTEFPWVRLMKQSANLGFTGGQNLALGKRLAADALLLNSDTVVHAGALRRMIDFAAAHEAVGIIGPRLLNPDGSLQLSCRRFPNPVAALYRNTLIGRLFPNNAHTARYLMLDWDHAQPRKVDWVSGAALYAKGAMIERVGLLDEKFFMFCEDVDWCRRAWDAGFEVMYLPDAVITHAIGRSTDKVANRMIVRFHRSMLLYYRKHMLSKRPVLLRPVLAALAAAGLGARAGSFLIKNGMDELKRRLRR